MGPRDQAAGTARGRRVGTEAGTDTLLLSSRTLLGLDAHACTPTKMLLRVALLRRKSLRRFVACTAVRRISRCRPPSMPSANGSCSFADGCRCSTGRAARSCCGSSYRPMKAMFWCANLRRCSYSSARKPSRTRAPARMWKLAARRRASSSLTRSCTSSRVAMQRGCIIECRSMPRWQ